MTWLSVILGVLLLGVEVLIGRKNRLGWWLYLGCLPGLVYMNVALRLYGLLPLNLGVLVNAVVAIRSWSRDDRIRRERESWRKCDHVAGSLTEDFNG